MAAAQAYREALAGVDDQALVAALERNIYGGAPAAGGAPACSLYAGGGT